MKKLTSLISVLIVACSFSLMGSNIKNQIKYATKIQESQPDSCILLSHDVLTILKEYQVLDKATTYWNLAQGYLYKHQYYTSLFYALKAKELFHENDTSSIFKEIMGTLGWVYFDIGNPAQAVPYHKKALEIAQKNGSFRSEVRYHNALGLDAYASEQYDKALNYFQKALFMVEQCDSTYSSSKSMLQNNIGLIYIAYENWAKAETFLKSSLENNLGRPTSLLETYSLLAKVMLREDRLSECFQYLEKCELLTQQTNYSFSLLEYYKVRIGYDEKVNNFASAFQYQKKFIKLHSKINNKEIQEVMNYMLESQKEKMEKDELLIAQAKELKDKRTILGGVTFLVLLLIVGIFYYVFKSRAERALLKQRLLKEELKYKQKEQEQLNDELAYKSEKLESLALNINQRNEIVNALSDQIKKAESKEIKEGWKQFLNVIQQSQDSNILSEELVQNFMYRLNSKFPSLTEKEQSLVVDIRNNLTSKEMAEKYHIEVKSIEMSRYRLRKKMNLEKGVQLRDYILEI